MIRYQVSLCPVVRDIGELIDVVTKVSTRLRLQLSPVGFLPEPR